MRGLGLGFGIRARRNEDHIAWARSSLPSVMAHSPAYVWDIRKSRLARTIVAAGDVGSASAADLARLINAAESEAWANFSNASTVRTAVEADGGISGAYAASVPRMDYTHGIRQMLLEDAGTRVNNILCDSWSSVSATIVALGAEGLLRPISIASTGATWNRAQIALLASVVTDQTYYGTIIYRGGTAGKCRVFLHNTVGNSDSLISGTVGSLSVTSTSQGSATITEQTIPPDGSHRVDFTWTPNFDGAAAVAIGPDSATSGQSVIAVVGQLSSGAGYSFIAGTQTSSTTRTADDMVTSDLLEALRVASFQVRAWPHDTTPDTISSDTIANGKRYDLIAALPAAEDISDIEALTYDEIAA